MLDSVPGKFCSLAAVALSALLICHPGNCRAQALQSDGPVQALESEPLSVVTKMGKFEFSVEVADTAEERGIGLMNRRSMDPKNGMLFDFGRNEPVAMWMKNTYIPLDMIFIRQDGSVARIAENTTPQSEEVISSGEAVSFVLELNAGMARLVGLKPGDRIEHRLIGAR